MEEKKAKGPFLVVAPLRFTILFDCVGIQVKNVHPLAPLTTGTRNSADLHQQ